MLPARISDPTNTAHKPDNWDEKRHGHVGALAFRSEVISGVTFMCSAWEIEPDEALDLVAGAKMILGVSAPQHPVVRLAVMAAPPQLTRTTVIREEYDRCGELTVVVETLFPALPGIEGSVAHRGRCQIVLGHGGAPPAVARAMADLEIMAVSRGWIPA